MDYSNDGDKNESYEKYIFKLFKKMNRVIVLHGRSHRDMAKHAIDCLPPGVLYEVVIRDHEQDRKSEQNRLYWKRLDEISAQAFIGGKRYDSRVLHEYAKRGFLPDACHKNVEKWCILPSGERELCMGTGDLTVHEFSDYLIKVEAFGASLGVKFSDGIER